MKAQIDYELNGLSAVKDDLEAKRIAASMGVLGRFEDNPAPDGEPGQGVCRGVIDYDDPEHWVLVCHYSGWVKPEDNGYAVFMLDRSRFGLEVATAVFGALMGCGDGPSYSTFIEKTSGLN